MPSFLTDLRIAVPDDDEVEDVRPRKARAPRTMWDSDSDDALDPAEGGSAEALASSGLLRGESNLRSLLATEADRELAVRRLQRRSRAAAPRRRRRRARSRRRATTASSSTRGRRGGAPSSTRGAPASRRSRGL